MARLPSKVALAVLTFVDQRLAGNPQRLSKVFSGELADLRSARNGDYRVLFRIDDQAAAIWIVHIDHRAHAYRRC